MADIERRRITVPGATLAIGLAGPGGRLEGSPAICVTHPAESFVDAARWLADAAGAPVVCIAPRGIGGSSPAPGGALTIDGAVDDVEAVRRALGVERWLYWGMSGGSMVGQRYAIRHPDALTGLLLFSAGPCWRRTLTDPACVVSPSHPAWRGPLAAAAIVDGSADPAPPDGATWRRLGAGWAWCRADGRALLVSPVELSAAMRSLLPALWAFDTRADLASVRLPALVLGGTADPIAPIAHVRELHERLAGSTFAAIDGAGHAPLSDRASEVTAAVRRFVAGNRSRGVSS